jgi:hypothetical protein
MPVVNAPPMPAVLNGDIMDGRQPDVFSAWEKSRRAALDRLRELHK